MQEAVHSSTETTDVAIIGAGNVATHLGKAIAASGTRIVGVWSPHTEHARALAANLDCPAFVSLEQLPQASLCIISVKDDALPDVARQVGYLYSKNANSIIAHTAGSMPIDILTSFHKRAAVIYPLQTLSRFRPVNFREVSLFIEGSTEQVVSSVKTFCSKLSDHVETATSLQRKRIHLAAVFACNFPNHCYAIAQQLLRESGLDERCIIPLVEETAHKLRTLPAAEAQTGPAVRRDTKVIAAQSEQLASHPLWQSIYKAMSQSIHDFQPSKD